MAKKILLKHDAGFILPHDIELIDKTLLEKFVAHSKDEKKMEVQQKNAFELAKKFSLAEASRKYEKILEFISSKSGI